MDVKLCVVFVTVLAAANGVQQQSNYEISRNKLGSGGGGGYGQYNPDYPNYNGQGALYPSGPGYPGSYPGSNYPSNYPGSNYPSNYPGSNYPSNYPGSNYPSNYPGSNYPGNYPNHKPGLAGPPGAHPGCPLCDSSVYSYCSSKQAHDACCCENSSSYYCRKADCKFLHANSCQEYNLISSCCCVDVNKSAAPVVPVVV